MKITRLAGFRTYGFIAAALICAFALSARAADDKPEDKAKEQEEVRKLAQQTLQRLYKAQPAAQSAVEHGAGYAVFSNTGVKILFAGSGKGKGIAVDNQTKKEV